MLYLLLLLFLFRCYLLFLFHGLLLIGRRLLGVHYGMFNGTFCICTHIIPELFVRVVVFTVGRMMMVMMYCIRGVMVLTS